MADGSVIFDTQLDESGLKAGLEKISSTLASGLTTALGAAEAALAGLGTYAVGVGSDFEAAVSNVAATMGKTTDEIRRRRKDSTSSRRAALTRNSSFRPSTQPSRSRRRAKWTWLRRQDS